MRAKRVILYVPKSRNYESNFKDVKLCTASLRVTESQPRRQLRKQTGPFLDTSSEKKRFLLLFYCLSMEPLSASVKFRWKSPTARCGRSYYIEAHFECTTTLVPRHQEYRRYDYYLSTNTKASNQCDRWSNRQHELIRQLIY